MIQVKVAMFADKFIVRKINFRLHDFVKLDYG